MEQQPLNVRDPVTCPEALLWQLAFVVYLTQSRIYPTSACGHVAPFFWKRVARLSGQLATACLEHQGIAFHCSNTMLSLQAPNRHRGPYVRNGPGTYQHSHPH